MDAPPISPARAALGMALGARASESVERTWAAARQGGFMAYSPAYDEQQRQSTYFGTLLIARWLVCGQATDAEEHAWLTRSGRTAVADQVPMWRTVRGYLGWRDAVVAMLGEEAARLETPPEDLRVAVEVVHRSCDAALSRMARDQDEHRARMSHSLAVSETRFRDLYQAVGCGVVLIDPGGRVLDSNRAAAEILGIEPEELRAANFIDVGVRLQDEAGRETVPLAVETLRCRRAIQGRVVEVSGGQIRPRWVQAGAVPAFDDRGEIFQILLTYIDVTPVHEAERARAESAAKSRFLATMSHELRTPLNSILGFAQLVKMHHGEALDEREGRYLDNIESSGRHLLALINDVLDLTKVAAGHLRVAAARVPVIEVIEEVERELQPLAALKGLDVKVNVEPSLVVVADPVRVRQVVTNLVSNAVKCTDEGGIVLGARADGARVEIEVVDSGIGIPSDQLERVFEEFTQVEDGITRPREGTGLGLPLARRLTELMGGSLEISSEIGRGTRAVIRLPAGR